MQKKSNQSKIFEFKPKENIRVKEILELVGLIRIGVPGHIYDEASVELRNHLEEVVDGKKRHPTSVDGDSE
jgi:hypothetical protein